MLRPRTAFVAPASNQGAEFVHIAGMNRSGEINDIQIYEVDENNRLLATRYAEKGVYRIEKQLATVSR